MIKHLNFLISSFTFGWEITVKKLGFGTYNTMGHFMVHTYYYYFMYSIPAKSYKNKVIYYTISLNTKLEIGKILQPSYFISLQIPPLVEGN